MNFQLSQEEKDRLQAYCEVNQFNKSEVLRAYIRTLPDCRLEAPQPTTVSTEVQND